MLFGIDRLGGAGLSALRRRVENGGLAVLTHAAAVDRAGRHLLDVLADLGLKPQVLFAPEHGFEAAVQAELAVSAESAAPSGREGPQVVSLYGATRESLEPKPEHWEGISVLLIDLADVGSRYYTYVWTALLSARSAAAAGVHTVVLDRPNPISGNPSMLEGAPQDEGFTSFVGLERIPVRHSMTLGEILAMFIERDGKPLGAEGALSVVRTVGWERLRTASAWGRPFIMPSPNMPTAETALVYPGGCLVEGTNLSEGRGTTAPFQMVGAPFLDGPKLADALWESRLPGMQVRPVTFVPTFEKHAGQSCHGVMLHVTDPLAFRPVTTYAILLAHARKQAPGAFAFRSETYEFEERPAFDVLTGSTRAREAILADAHPEAVAELIAPVDPLWAEVVPEAEERLLRAEP